MSSNPYYDGPPSPHYDGQRFFNPDEPNTDRSLGDIIRWRRTSTPARWPRAVEVATVVPDANPTVPTITMVGHATLLLQLGGVNVLTDPVWSTRASPLSFAGPRRVTAAGVAFDDLPPIHAVFVSHNHYDHLDIATLKRLEERHHPLFVTPLGNDTILKRHLRSPRVQALDWWAHLSLDGGTRLSLVPAVHWSSRTPFDRRRALWGGMVLSGAGKQIYFAGDTGYGTGAIFREIRRAFGPMDAALIPIGAYAPRWFMSAQHADPAEAVQIMRDLEARMAIGIHWGSFQLTDEARDEPSQLLNQVLLERGIAKHRFPAALPGQSFTV